MKIKLLYPHSKCPSRATEHSVGYDCYAAVDEVIYPGEVIKISLGFKMEAPPNTAPLLIARSGLGTNKGIIMANQVGLVDPDYRGEVFAPLFNRSDIPFQIMKGDRICQMLIVHAFTPEIQAVSELSETARGEGGFGSTGVSQ